MTSLSFFWQDLLRNPYTMGSVVLALVPLLLGAVFFVLSPKLFLLIVKNLGRNKLRTILTSLAIMVLVLMVTMIWTVVFFLDQVTTEKAKDLKIIITEKYQIPSQMPPTYATYLDPASGYGAYEPGKYGIGKGDFMTWSFYGGSLDPNNRTLENLVFMFVMNPDHIIPMMDDMQDLDPSLVEKLRANLQGVLIGREKLATIGKRVGDRFKLSSINYKGIDLEFEIVGELPEGRYDNSAIMNKDYFNRAFDDYERANGSQHPLADRNLNLVWLRVPTKEDFQGASAEIEGAKVFTDPYIKVQTASSGVAAFLDAYRDLLWGVKWLLIPAILCSMALVVANAIGISVRERMKEIAVMKVLGYRPGQILILVLGESMLVGGLSGLAAAGVTFYVINHVIGGIKFPIGFFPAFYVPIAAFWWGLAVGFVTAFAGSVLPALSARSIKVSEVFSKVA